MTSLNCFRDSLSIPAFCSNVEESPEFDLALERDDDHCHAVCDPLRRHDEVQGPVDGGTHACGSQRSSSHPFCFFWAVELVTLCGEGNFSNDYVHFAGSCGQLETWIENAPVRHDERAPQAVCMVFWIAKMTLNRESDEVSLTEKAIVDDCVVECGLDESQQKNPLLKKNSQRNLCPSPKNRRCLYRRKTTSPLQALPDVAPLLA